MVGWVCCLIVLVCVILWFVICLRFGLGCSGWVCLRYFGLDYLVMAVGRICWLFDSGVTVVRTLVICLLGLV